MHDRFSPSALVRVIQNKTVIVLKCLNERYGDGVEGFYNYIWQMHNTYPQYPIWITEYASTSTNSSGAYLDFTDFLS